MAGKARLLGDLIGNSGLKFLNNAENASDLVKHAKISEGAAEKFINLRNSLSGQRLTADTDISGMKIRQSTFDKINKTFGEVAGNASASTGTVDKAAIGRTMHARQVSGVADKEANYAEELRRRREQVELSARDRRQNGTNIGRMESAAQKAMDNHLAESIDDMRRARAASREMGIDPDAGVPSRSRIMQNIEASRAARENSNNGGFSRQLHAETWLDRGAKTDSDLARQLTDPVRKRMGLSDSDADWLKARKEALDVVRTFEEGGHSLRNPENLRRTQEAWGKAPSQPVGKGTDAASTSVNAAEAEKAGGATTEATRDAATQVPTAAGGGGTTGGLSFDNYSRDAQAAIIKEQGKSYWGRSAQERFHLDSMDRRYSEINKMKAGEERNAAIERFNQDLQSGPGFNDYMNGNQVYGKAAGVGVAALTASAVMGDGRRSNAQLYSSPF